MAKINVLPLEIAELIAAGEVVERPASIVKETVENSIDAGSKHITVEINRGGITYIRITDDGCGIAFDDVPLAFLRHATSKIRSGDDLFAISTLGFRGEALAATSAVSKVELFTKTADSDLGTHYRIDGGVQSLYEQSGCPDGTTLIVRDIFYNTPARMKFLKKDSSEGNTVAAVVERAALSHPEIAFKFIRDGKQTLSTTGDGKLESAIYSVLGRDFVKSLIPVLSKSDCVSVEGFTCKPVFCRASRAGQFVFLNNRLVHSGTVTAATEQAYKNSAMVGKFPAFVLNIKVPFDTVDVNVHPAKTEVRFSDERKIFEAVYYAVKSALAFGDTRPEIPVGAPAKKPAFVHMSTEEYRQQAIPTPAKKSVSFEQAKPENTDLPKNTVVERAYQNQIEKPVFNRFNSDNIPDFYKNIDKKPSNEIKTDINITKEPAEDVTVTDVQNAPDRTEAELPPEEEIRYVGEAFSTYIVVEKKNSLFLIDKHAAHERIIFNRLKASEKPQSQALLVPVTVRLGRNEYDAVLDHLSLMEKAGFEIEDFGNSSVMVRAVPSALTSEDVASTVTEAAASLAEKGNVELSALDRIFHTVSCKAAIKAGYKTSVAEQLNLAKTVLCNNDILYCPHGRPVAFEIKQRELEKQFGRIQ